MQELFFRGGGGRHSLNFIILGFLGFALLGGVFLCVEPDAASAAGTPCSITPVLTEADLNACIAEAPTDNSEFTITIGASFNLTVVKTIAVGKNITLGSNVAGGATLSLQTGNTARHFIVNGTLTLEDGVTLQGYGDGVTIGGGVLVASGGTFIMNGGVISGNTSSVAGGVAVAGTFIMNNGEISGNTATNYGGGISMSGATATFTMNGGKISGNTTRSGGGMLVGGSSTFNMFGGEISGNTANNGGGAYIDGGAKFNISGGAKIVDNTAASHGGGLWIISMGVVTMTGGQISGNTANKGGGVWVTSSSSDDGEFVMTGGQISGNTAAELGGGVFLNGGAVTLGGSAQIGVGLGVGNGIYLNTDMVAGVLSGFAGLVNIEGAEDAYLGRPVAEGASGYTIQTSDIARFRWLPANFALEFNNDTSQIILGLVPEAPSTGQNNSGGPGAVQIASGVVASLVLVSSIVLVKRRLRIGRGRI